MISRHGVRLGAAVVAAMLSGGCTPFVRYTNDLVDSKAGRSWLVRAPAGIGGTLGFVVGVPVDLAAMPLSWVVYRAQPKETRDVISVFLFPSFVLWKVGALVGVPFDLLEFGLWRWWNRQEYTLEEREAIERIWDEREYSDYPVTAIYPGTAPAGRAEPDVRR
ncbi:MAG: hypothetical protein KDC98_18945 [Planctomycetes bacterium]|nr:hypothetical protein [Planctomycetota bacterium]